MHIVNATSNMRFFHLSPTLLSPVLSPRIPNNKLTQIGVEDSITPRVCFAPTVDQCLLAIHNSENESYYVYEPLYYSELKLITSYELRKHKSVPDVSVTQECWSTVPVKLCLVGKVKVLNPTERVFMVESETIRGDRYKMDLWCFDWLNIS